MEELFFFQSEKSSPHEYAAFSTGFAKRGPIAWKRMRKLPYFSLDLIPHFTVFCWVYDLIPLCQGFLNTA